MEADGKKNGVQKHLWTFVSAQHFLGQNLNLLLPRRLFPYCVNQRKCRYGIWVTFKEDCPKKKIAPKEQNGSGHQVSRVVKTWQDAGLKTGRSGQMVIWDQTHLVWGQWPPHHPVCLGVFVQVTKTTFELGRHLNTTIWHLNTQLPVHISYTRGSRAAVLQRMLMGSRCVSNAESISKKGALQEVNTKRFSCCHCGHISHPSSLSSLKNVSLNQYCSSMGSRMRKNRTK